MIDHEQRWIESQRAASHDMKATAVLSLLAVITMAVSMYFVAGWAGVGAIGVTVVFTAVGVIGVNLGWFYEERKKK